MTKVPDELRSWGALPSDAKDPNFGRVCMLCNIPIRAGGRYDHVCDPTGLLIGRVRQLFRAYEKLGVAQDQCVGEEGLREAKEQLGRAEIEVGVAIAKVEESRR